jgi:acetylxylan esterase
MVSYTLTKYNGDKSRVFATGSSSGAMMTNVLAGAYPDVFAAGASFSGVPDGCFIGSPSSSPSTANPACANGQLGLSADQWVSRAKQSYPSYTGRRTRMQIWHGTADNVVYYPNLAFQLEQWAGVLGVSFSHNVSNTPQSGYTEIVYGDGTQLVGYSAFGVGHYVPTNEVAVLNFFGIPSGTTTTPTTTPTTPYTTTTTTTSTPGQTTTPSSGSTGSAQH